MDVGFLIADSFYYRPENDFTTEQSQQFREPLFPPSVKRYGDYLLSTELGESTVELVRYYQDVVRLAAHHGKQIQYHSQYFWMRPLISARGEFAITFPWYDTWEEAIPVLDAVARSGDGSLFQDMDQGWEFHTFAEGDRLFLRQGDVDSGEEQLVIAADRAQIAGQLPAVRAGCRPVARVVGGARPRLLVLQMVNWLGRTASPLSASYIASLSSTKAPRSNTLLVSGLE